MITIEKLQKSKFFETISRIKELGNLNGIKDIYVVPPIISNDVLYLMVTTKDGGNIEKFFQFSNAIKNIFVINFDLHIYEENALKEGIIEESVFSEEYKNALNSGILIDQLKQDIPLDEQWDQQKRQKSNHAGLKYQKVFQNNTLKAAEDKDSCFQFEHKPLKAKMVIM